MRPQGVHFALTILDNPKISNIASIDKYSLACCIFPPGADFSGRRDVINTHSLKKVKWFSHQKLHELTFCVT